MTATATHKPMTYDKWIARDSRAISSL